jgi:gliding motility-associated-like protein
MIMSLNTIYGQSYFANGNARALGGNCYQLTGALDWQLGSVWYADPIDLSKDFDLEFYLNFGGKDDSGADGIVFVMQDVSNKAIGKAGGGLGFEGFSPSFGIEFDDFNNQDKGDLVSDHIAILKNGSVDHNSSNSISAPVTALPGAVNIEDGQDHLVRIVWIENIKELQVWFDCNLRQQITYDIQKNIFNGDDLVYWGFTSSTGGLNNRQTVCLRDDILIDDTMTLCKGESILLNARESKNDQYTWSPNLYLNNNSIRTPSCSTTQPITYYVEYKDLCDNAFKDTLYVDVDEPFTLDDAQDTLLCNGVGYSFDLSSIYDSVRWNSGSRSRKVTWLKEGKYSYRAWQGVCYSDDTFNITISVDPVIKIMGDSLFCEGDSTLLNLEINPSDAVYQWEDGLSSLSRYFNSSDDILVIAKNGCDSVTQDYTIRQIILEDLFLGRDTLLCIGDTLTLDPKLNSLVNYLWSTGSDQPRFDVTTAGSYILQISKENRCYDSDTIIIDELEVPILEKLDDILLCKREKIKLTIPDANGQVIWNSQEIGESFTLENIEGRVDVKMANICGEDSASFDVSLIDCYCDMIYPNAFTPNDDNLNDYFKPIVDCPKLFEFRLQVYNRWGELIFETTDVSKSWDGSFQNTRSQDGVYFWTSNWTGILNGISQVQSSKGVVHLMR